MYRTCIFCSRDLGSNESIEEFPVGSRLAFDSFKGRLWAVCPRCGRWNLAPIEERWEAVESAERLFSDARQRVQSENIGLAKLRDGTRLVRIGKALPGELAAWRYGAQLIKRNTRLKWYIGGSIVAGGALIAGIPFLAGVGLPLTGINVLIQGGGALRTRRAQERIVLSLSEAESPTGRPLALRRKHLDDAQLDIMDGQLGMLVREPRPPQSWLRELKPEYWDTFYTRAVRIIGADAQLVAARAMVDHNTFGAGREDVGRALGFIERAGSAEAYIARLAKLGPTIMPSPRRRPREAGHENIDAPHMPKKTYPLGRTDALAFEMALHDASERRAMEGELSQLEDAWREAEEIAAIADALPDEPPPPAVR